MEMNSINIKSPNECRELLLKKGINRFKVDEWYGMLSSSTFDIIEYDRMVYYFAYNIEGFDGFASRKASVSFLEKVEEAVYERVKDERLRGQVGVFAGIGFSTAIQAISNTSSVGEVVIEMFFSLVLTEILNIGVIAWCKYYESKKQNEGK